MAYYGVWLDSAEQRNLFVAHWRRRQQLQDEDAEASVEQTSLTDFDLSFILQSDNNHIMWACAKSCNIHLLLRMLDATGDDLPLHHLDDKGRNALHIACFLCNDLEVVRFLIHRTKGAEINRVCKEGYSALMYVCRRAVSSNFQIVTTILKSVLHHPGIDLALKNKRGKTALDIARLSMNKDIKQLLAEKMEVK